MILPKRYLITSALPYANGLKHIGHLAGAYLPADIYVRYLRAQKRDVVFVCGSDEHGTAIPIQATKENTTPQAIIDKYHEICRQNFEELNISFDIYHRTSSELHHKTAQEFFTNLYNDGVLEEKETEQYYDEQAKTFLADRYIKGTCPNCGYENAFGDQCEKCGKSLSPDELINPVSTLSGNVPVKKMTNHWYLPLNKHEDFLREWILKGHQDDWKANVLGQCKSWIEGGLMPRAVTRDLDWGIKLPSLPNPSKGGAYNTQSKDSALDYLTADPMIYGILKQFAIEHKANPTEAEKILWELIRGKKLDGYKFRRQHIIGSYIADFVCISKHLIIEVDGLVHQVPENKVNDEERSIELNKLGFDVIRFTNEQVVNQPEYVVDFILNKIKLIDNTKDVSLNPPLEGREAGKVLYVWFDAPIGYISATKQWAINNNKDWSPYWNDKDTKLVHFVGKDNIVFHCIIFPVMLKLNNNILPENVPANEFMNLEGDKMSTSRHWKIDMQDYIDDFVNKENGGSQCVDMLRYYLTQIAPETKDSEFTWKGFQDAVNSELVAIYANFINRAMVLMHKLSNGKVPPVHQPLLDEKDKALMEEIKNTKTKISDLIENYKFRDAQFEVIDLARKGNKYMQDKEPWIVAKSLTENPEAQKLIDNCLHICLQLTANLAVLMNPFLPNTASKICGLLKLVPKVLDWENAGKMNLLSVGYTLRAPELLFRKIEDEEIKIQVAKLKAGLVQKETDQSTATTITEIKPTIEFDDFAKIDLKVGTITAAEKVAKADKLLKLEVDLGFEKRTIVSGIALHYKPEDIIGKKVTVVTNLAPRKMKGIESAGMILMAEDAEGKLHFISTEKGVNDGSGVS
jgi:methionine--tRNA ligase beta chain